MNSHHSEFFISFKYHIKIISLFEYHIALCFYAVASNGTSAVFIDLSVSYCCSAVYLAETITSMLTLGGVLISKEGLEML